MRALVSVLFLIPLLSFAQPADGVVQRPDLTLHYRSVGYGEPLLILSGGPGLEVSYMNGLADHLAKHNRCILLEQRGTGRSQPSSGKPDTYAMSAYVGDVEALRQDLHLSTLNILGHSWGGMLAMAYAAKYPNRVASLVLLSSGGTDMAWLDTVPDLTKRLAPEDLRERAIALHPTLRRRDPERSADMALNATLPAYFYDRGKGLQYKQATKGAHVVNRGVLAQTFAALDRTGWDIRVPLTAYHGPTLIVQGDHDMVGDNTAREIQRTIPDSNLLYIDHCGHFTWIERPDVLYAVLDAFLAAYAGEEENLGEEFPVPVRVHHHRGGRPGGGGRGRGH